MLHVNFQLPMSSAERMAESREPRAERLPDLRRAALEVVAPGKVLRAELLHTLNARRHHLEHLFPRHHVHVHGNVQLHVELLVVDVVEPAVAPPLKIFSRSGDIASIIALCSGM